MMKTEEIIINALKHFIRYNKNREEIFIRYYGHKRKVEGLCEYVRLYSHTSLGLHGSDFVEVTRENREEYSRYLRVTSYFSRLVSQYINLGVYISSKYRVTKKRLSIAQKIINKLEKQLQSS